MYLDLCKSKVHSHYFTSQLFPMAIAKYKSLTLFHSLTFFPMVMMVMTQAVIKIYSECCHFQFLVAPQFLSSFGMQTFSLYCFGLPCGSVCTQKKSASLSLFFFFFLVGENQHGCYLEQIQYYRCLEKQASPFDSRFVLYITCLLYTSPSPRDIRTSRMPSSA